MILDKWDSKFLTFKEDTHEYFWKNEKIPRSVSAVIEKFSPYKNGDIDAKILENAAFRGTTVHKWIEDFFNGVPEVQRFLPESFKGYIIGFQKWWKFFKENLKGDYSVASEVKLFSLKNNFAGTIDLIIIDPVSGVKYLIDFKTNAKITPDLVTAQLGGYTHLAREWSSDGESLNLQPAYVQLVNKPDVVKMEVDGNFNFTMVDVKKATSLFNECLEDSENNDGDFEAIKEFNEKFADKVLQLKVDTAKVSAEKRALEKDAEYVDLKNKVNNSIIELLENPTNTPSFLEKVEKKGVLKSFKTDKIELGVRNTSRVDYQKILTQMVLDDKITPEYVDELKGRFTSITKSLSIK